MNATGFDLKTASPAIRKAAAALGIKSGKWEPVNAAVSVDALPDESVIARIWNRNYPNGFEITAGELRYAEQYLI